MTEHEPWRDLNYYLFGKIVRCFGCKKKCHRTHWGDWCCDCNVERIERINTAFESIK